MAKDETYHDDNTLAKVDEALRRAGLNPEQVREAINEMQNAGILFRERAATLAPSDPEVGQLADEARQRAAGRPKGFRLPTGYEPTDIKRVPEGYPRTFPGPNPPEVTDQDRAEIAGRIQAGTPPLVATSDVLARKLEQAGVERAPEGLNPTHPGLDGAHHIGHMEECQRCTDQTDRVLGSIDPRDTAPGY